MQTLHVSVSNQTLTLERDGASVREYPVSTSKYGLGFEEGSYKTPTGNFVIAEKIGGEQPIYTIFTSRQPVGLWDPKNVGSDPITSRIMWLSGTDEDNANTKDRFVYIHGTTEEHLIGQPASHGCIRMKNTDVVDLYERVAEGDKVIISL